MNNDNDRKNTGGAIPKNSPWITGLIFTVLLILTFLAGWAAGPLITKWQSESAKKEIAAAADSDGHDHGATAVSDAHTEDQWYVCPMHPWVVQQSPGICPICTMDLTPLDPERFSGEIAIDPTVVQNIGVRVEKVGLGTISPDLRSVGIIEADERRVSEVLSRVNGWIEKIYVNETGIYVRRGQHLLDIYSPELESVQRELLLLLENGNDVNSRLVSAAINRLKNLDMNKDEIERVMKEREIIRLTGLFSPTSGYVTEKKVDSGEEIRAGKAVYQITDLSHIWLKATVYEHQLSDIYKGQKVTISKQYQEGDPVTGTVDYIYPVVDAKTRQVEVRIGLNNSKLQFKPGMYATVRFNSDDKKDELAVLAPREAVIFTGEKSIVFISKGNGVFEPREVEPGKNAGNGYLAIRSGLSAGEHVVTSGQFLLDSESRIRESLMKMVRGDLATEQRPSLEMRTDHHDAAFVYANPSELEVFLTDYANVQNALYRGDLTEAVNYVGKLKRSFESIQQGSSFPAQANVPLKNARDALRNLVSAADLQSSRVAFAFFGDALNELLMITGLPTDLQRDYMGAQCGMFPDTPNNGIWIQLAGEAENPFYGKGSAMESCNSATWAFPVTGKIQQPKPAVMEMEKPETTPMKEDVVQTSPPLDSSLEAYFRLHDALFADDLGGAVAAADELNSALPASHPLKMEGKDQIAAISSADSLESARKVFGELSQVFHTWFSENGVGGKYAGRLVTKHCGMYPGVPQNGIWIQIKGDTENPFFGKDHFMAACAPEEWDLPEAR